MRLPAQLLRRRSDSHKGDYGHILIIAGSLDYTGAAILCANAAMRSGAGLVTLAAPKGLSNVFAKRLTEVIIKPLPQTKSKALSIEAFKQIEQALENIDILIVGPGLSQNKSTQQLIRKIVKNANKPMILDADGLNALVGHLDILRRTTDDRRQTIVTPHPGEMARLVGTTTAKIQENRMKFVRKFSLNYNCVVVLKGHRTIVFESSKKAYINPTGNPGMATAGSGDVLSGVIGSFLVQGLNAFDAAKYGVYIHGLAGDLAAKKKTQLGLIASDIIEYIPKAIKNSFK